MQYARLASDWLWNNRWNEHAVSEWQRHSLTSARNRTLALQTWTNLQKQNWKSFGLFYCFVFVLRPIRRVAVSECVHFARLHCFYFRCDCFLCVQMISIYISIICIRMGLCVRPCLCVKYNWLTLRANMQLVIDTAFFCAKMRRQSPEKELWANVLFIGHQFWRIMNGNSWISSRICHTLALDWINRLFSS